MLKSINPFNLNSVSSHSLFANKHQTSAPDTAPYWRRFSVAACSLFSRFPAFLTLVAFGATGYIGHKTHWQFAHIPSETANAHTPDANHESSTPISHEQLAEAGIQLQSARSDSIREEISALATVTYNGHRYAQLATRADGHVYQVFVRVGQRVTKGEVLALVDSQSVGESKSNWLQAAATALYQQRLLEQLNQAAGAITQSRIRSVEAAARESELACYIAQQRLVNLGIDIDAKLDPSKPASELAEQIRFLGIPEHVVASLPEPPTTANLIALRSPFDGIVVEQHAVVGEMVTTNGFQFVVADTSTMWLKLAVRREDACKLSIGQSIVFCADGVAEPFKSTLAWIEPEIDPETQTVQAGCVINNRLVDTQTLTENAESEHRILQANQFGTVKICIANRPHAVLIPESAIQHMPDQSTVAFVARNGSVDIESRPIRLGTRQNGLIEILDGIREGEQVVSQGSFILKSEFMRASLIGG